MKEIALDVLSSATDEGTVLAWFVEEGDVVQEGDDLVELSSEDGAITIQAPVSGILTEVYYDEGESVPKGEVLCVIDDEDEDDYDSDEDE